jgi:hypothetical protein
MMIDEKFAIAVRTERSAVAAPAAIPAKIPASNDIINYL